MVTLQEKVLCWFSNDALKPRVIVYKISEGTDRLKAALELYVKPTGYGCLCKTCGLQNQ
jgi:hypothetical protein